MVVINKLHKIIISLLLICFVYILAGSVINISFQRIGIEEDLSLSLFSGFSFCLLVFLLTIKFSCWTEMLSGNACLVVSLFILALIAGIITLFSFSARVTQFSDSLDVMDSALYLSKHGKLSENLPYIKYVGSFGNNYPQILLQSYLAKSLIRLGSQDVENTLNHLNVIILITVILLTWLIVKETRGIKAATNTAFICLLNPYFYLIVNWTYSMTYSLPIMMGVLYITLRLKGNKSAIGGVILALLEGMLIGIGFLIRPTSVFPLIAAIIVWLPFLKKKISKHRAIQFLCILSTMILIMTFVNIHINRRFSNIKSQNLPLTFWLMMGSHDNGIWSDADFYTVRSIPDSSERVQFALDQTVKNYDLLHIDGTVNLWLKKLNTLWNDGGFFYRSPIVSESTFLSDYYLGSGARNQLMALYCQSFRLFLILGFLLTCIVMLSQKHTSEINLIMMITIFGGCFFHTIWETNVRYSIPFLLPLIISVEYGISAIQRSFERERKKKKKKKRGMPLAFMVFLIIVSLNLNTALNQETMLNFHRLFSSEATRYSQAIEPCDFRLLEQDFYTDKPFNTLFFRASLPEQITREECSEYELSILNEKEQVLLKSQILPQQISGTGIKVSFDMVSGYDHYYVHLEKTDPEKESLLFYTQYTYGVDPYRGILSVNNGPAYPSDLLMDVYEERQTTIYGVKARIVVMALILITGVFVAFGPVRSRNLNSSRFSH